MTPDDLRKIHPLLAEAIQFARDSNGFIDADGEPDPDNEDHMAKMSDYAGDRFIAWVGKMDGHPWYTRNE